MRVTLNLFLLMAMLSFAMSGCKSNNSPNASNEGKPPTGKSPTVNAGLRIKVNVPAFQLVLWQNDTIIKSYEIGVGQKEYPIFIGKKKARKIIWNPDWVPPNSKWVTKMKRVRPGERIKASDGRNPLGKLKIPLGSAYLIHQAAKPSDIGHLASHGCIRMRKADLLDLADRIAAAYPLSQSEVQQISSAKRSKVLTVIKLAPPLPVDISYNTLVIKDNVLHIYPDVYAHGTNSVSKLRVKLKAAGVDDAKLEETSLTQMIKHVNSNEEFIASLADINAGQALTHGRNQPLTSQSGRSRHSASMPHRNRPGRQ